MSTGNKKVKGEKEEKSKEKTAGTASASLNVHEEEQEAATAKCGECKQAVTTTQTGLQCEVCQDWFHTECQDMPLEVYSFLCESGSSLHWYCRRCNKEVASMIAMMTKLQQRQDKIEGRQDKMESVLENLKARQEKLEKKTDDACNKMKGMQDEVVHVKRATSELETKLDTVIEAKLVTVKQSVKKDVSENLEIDKRKQNIVVHGMKEDDPMMTRTPAQTWMEIAERIIGHGLKLDPMKHIVETHRIGSPSQDKVRPLRIKLKSVESKIEVLKRAKCLKDVEEYKKVYISPDLTRDQQLLDKELREKVKAFRQQGETGVNIKGGKVIKEDGSGIRTTLFEFPKTREKHQETSTRS